MTKDLVLNSVNNDYSDRCVDFIRRPDGRFGFKAFRRDPEDQGGWTLTDFDPNALYPRYEDAVAEARSRVAWLAEAMDRAPPFVP